MKIIISCSPTTQFKFTDFVARQHRGIRYQALATQAILVSWMILVFLWDLLTIRKLLDISSQEECAIAPLISSFLHLFVSSSPANTQAAVRPGQPWCRRLQLCCGTPYIFVLSPGGNELRGPDGLCLGDWYEKCMRDQQIHSWHTSCWH